MATATHVIELPPVDLIDSRIRSCIKEVQALRKLRAVAVAMTNATESRLAAPPGEQALAQAPRAEPLPCPP
jgi:hypothetical protein